MTYVFPKFNAYSDPYWAARHPLKDTKWQKPSIPPRSVPELAYKDNPHIKSIYTLFKLRND